VIDYLERRRELRRLEDEAIAAGRLPAGQSLTRKWPVLQAGAVPHVDLATWRFSLSGLVAQERALSWDEFAALPRITSTSDIHCVTRWTKLDNEWNGPSARSVVELANPSAEAHFVVVHAPGYSANLPLDALLDDDVLFAITHDGQPLSPEHGFPTRLVVPKRYFWKSVKWVTGLEFSAEDRPGYWEVRGYHNEGDPSREERFSY
jgi:DMSO/TMAO reductase YedYZ molybdopterin-dependent catalytic subunit